MFERREYKMKGESIMEMFKTVIIFKPNETIAKEEIKKFTDIIQGWNKTKKVRLEDMGIKNLAYEIKHNKQGYYVAFTYQCHPAHIQELDRHLRIDEQVLKFITIKTDDDSSELEDYIPEESKQKRQPIDLLDIIYNL